MKHTAVTTAVFRNNACVVFMHALHMDFTLTAAIPTLHNNYFRQHTSGRDAQGLDSSSPLPSNGYHIVFA
jgi:hypothetical protein